MEGLNSHIANYRVSDFSGRYLNMDSLEKHFNTMPEMVEVEVAGISVKGRNIYRLTFGSGDIKIMMWSQMHGNETTTTKALLDLINFLVSEKPVLLSEITLVILPVVNPDGSAAYTRENANGVDLNRDAINLSQPESKVLRDTFNQLNPGYSFNLHDQRTLYNVGDAKKPATLSFLAPAEDYQKTVSAHRKKAMQLIAHLSAELASDLPGQIGRYSDTYNPNCVGDQFTSLGSATLLFEAGHFQGDYQREHTRGYVFKALVTALFAIAEGKYSSYSVDDYLKIPENGKQFMDIIIRNAPQKGKTTIKPYALGIRFKEILLDGSVIFDPEVAEKGDLENYYGHLTLDWSNPDERSKLQEIPGLIKLLQ